jgi:tyrosyl-tRNA synthetase
VGISEAPGEMFGKLMSISDDLMWRYYELLSFRSLADIAALRRDTDGGRNPRDAKVELAQEIVARFHSPAAAASALAEFDARFRRGAVPEDLPEVFIALDGTATLGIAPLLKQAGLVASTTEGQRSIEQGAVKVDGQRIEDRSLQMGVGSYVVQVGKRRWARVTLAARAS